jgi:hypothetical protein
MSDNVTVVPWGLHPLSPWVLEELNRRSNEYGQNPNTANNKPYSGPKTAWVRVFSNGLSKHPEAEGMDGFVLGGTYGFNESYGFDSDQKITIGVDAKGNPHKISRDTSNTLDIYKKPVSRKDFPHRPPPTLESISVESGGSSQTFPGLCRKITINWKCHSLAQLNYMAPYFLTPRISCLVEWGWNNYDTNALVDLTDLDWINNMFVDPSYTLEYIKESNGNYDAGLGFIVDYSYKINDYGGYDCQTSIINANSLLAGEQINNKEVTVKQGDVQLPVKSFREFVKKDIENIDSSTKEYSEMRKQYNLTGNIKEKVFRTSKASSGSSKNIEGMWLRMDLVQEIINAFFQITMENPKTAIIRNFDIAQTRMAANPFLKSASENVLVPNQYAPRFTYEETSNTAPTATPENSEYNLLFKDKIEIISKNYEGISTKFDNLKEVINKSGTSFPVYSPVNLYDSDGRLAQKLESGYWGNLRDLFINVKYIKKIVENNDSVLKMIEQLLQGINEALCQICQLKLIPAEYGNSKYSVYDQNLPGISRSNDAEKLPRITLGAAESSYIMSANFDVKLSQEMMNQLVMQSANPEKDLDGSTQTTNVKEKPIVSRYSAGDRLYRKGELKTITDSSAAPGSQSPEEKKKQDEIRRKKEEERRKEEEIQRKKKRQIRGENNKDTFLVYYEVNRQNPDIVNKYFLCEKNKDFLNYVLTLPNKSAPYLNNGIMPGTKLTLELLGISGIDYLSQFTLDHAPEAYNFTSAVWQVSDIKQSVSDKKWTTTITAEVRPLTIL